MNEMIPSRETGHSANHSLSAGNRESVTVTGVSDVVSFDETNVRLVTVCGILNLEGEGLRIHVLNLKEGTVAVTGRLNGVLYEDPDASAGEPAKKPRSRRFFGS
jgi:sporulation protein YabP